MSRFAIPCMLFMASACSTAPAVSTSTRHIHTADEARVQGIHVPAGTPFRIRLDQAIGTDESVHGDRFSAAILQPLADRSGVVIVQPGARVVGRVASVQGATAPRIRLELERVETIGGWTPIHATIEAAAAKIYAGQPEYSMVLIGENSLLESTHAETSRRARVYAGAPIGGGPTGYFYRVYRPRQVIIPVNATMDFVLARPLIPPGR